MAEPQTDTPNPAGADIGMLINSSANLTSGLAEIGRDKAAKTEKVIDDTERRLDQDQARATRAYEATGIGPNQLEPWDEQQQREKFHHEPLEAFGSLGSVIGLLGAAFVHAPMETGLNASAAAMNAIKVGDDQGYDRAFAAHKFNTDLVVKRHGMMREAYSDAITLMQTDMRAGEAKLQMEAARYGDRKVQFLLENGQSEELYKMLESRNKAVEGMAKAADSINESMLKKQAYDSTAKGIDMAAKQAEKESGQPTNPMETSARKLQAFNRIYKTKTDTPAQEILGTYLAQHPMATADELAEFADKHHLLPSYNRGSTDAKIIDALNAEHEVKGLPPPTAAEMGEALSKSKRGNSGSQNLTTDRQRAQDVLAYRQALKDEKNEDGTPKYSPDQIARLAASKESELKSAAAGVTANIANNGKIRLEQIKYSTEAIDKIEALLKKHNALTGLGGKLTRPAETLASVLGSNETDRHEFESLIAELREWGPRIMTNSSGRPLSAEQSNIANVIRGTNLGDTTKITAERLYNYKKLLQEMSADTEKRIKLAPDERGSVTPPKSDGGEKPWERDRRLQGKTSALESQDDAA